MYTLAAVAPRSCRMALVGAFVLYRVLLRARAPELSVQRVCLCTFACEMMCLCAIVMIVRLPELNTTALQPFLEADVRVLSTWGGDALPLAAWERRNEIAEQILQWVLKYNITGIHNDWENHGVRPVQISAAWVRGI